MPQDLKLVDLRPQERNQGSTREVLLQDSNLVDIPNQEKECGGRIQRAQAASEQSASPQESASSRGGNVNELNTLSNNFLTSLPYPQPIATKSAIDHQSILSHPSDIRNQSEGSMGPGYTGLGYQAGAANWVSPTVTDCEWYTGERPGPHEGGYPGCVVVYLGENVVFTSPAVVAATTMRNDCVAAWRGVLEQPPTTTESLDFNVESHQTTIEYLDSGAGKSMSGDISRLSELSATNVRISGFNSSASVSKLKGTNSDGVEELFVPDMPVDRVLLSVHDYTKGGKVVILTEDGGSIHEISPEELEKFKAKNSVLLDVGVKNGVYHILRGHVETEANNLSFHVDAMTVDMEFQDEEDVELEVLGLYAAKYFNAKSFYDNNDELILGHILSGFSLRQLRTLVANESMTGLSPHLTVGAIDYYERKHGSTPDVVKKSLPLNRSKVKGYGDQPFTVKSTGQCVEIDGFYYRFKWKNRQNHAN